MKSDSRWLRIVQIVLFFIIVIGILLLATYRLWTVQVGSEAVLISLRGNQDIKTTPIEIPAPTDPVIRNANYSFGELSFSAPWAGGQLKESSLMSVVRFPDIKASVILGRANGLYTAAVGTSTEMKELLSSYTGNYDYYRAMTNVTPADIHPFTFNKAPLKELVIRTMLLVEKSILFVTYGNPVYSFETKSGIHVFEFTKSATSTVTTLFTPNDRQFDFIIMGASRAESNSILESLRPN